MSLQTSSEPLASFEQLAASGDSREKRQPGDPEASQGRPTRCECALWASLHGPEQTGGESAHCGSACARISSDVRGQQVPGALSYTVGKTLKAPDL